MECNNHVKTMEPRVGRSTVFFIITLLFLFACEFFCFAERPLDDVLTLEEPQKYVQGEVIVKFSDTALLEDILRAAGLNPGSVSRLYPIKYAVSKFKKEYSISQSPDTWYSFIGKNYCAFSGLSDEDVFKKAYDKMPQSEKAIYRTYKLKIDNSMNVEDVITFLKRDARVEYAEPNYIVKAQIVPDDPYYSTRGAWGQTYDDLWGIKKCGAADAWEYSQGEGVIVAVIDTGVDYNHEDIIDNMWKNLDEIPENNIDDDGNGFIDDVNGWDFAYWSPRPLDVFGHGTHCAGTIASTGNNNKGVIGVAPRAKIMAVKALGDEGYGDVEQMSQAIVYAVNEGAMVLSNSWGFYGTSNAVTDAFHYADSKGVVCVAAAGNDNTNMAGFSPANIDTVITVAATDESDQKAYFSNNGYKVDVSAPGVNILSLRAEGSDMYGDGEHFVPVNDNSAKYYRASGTSMACPHVAGEAALIISKYRETLTCTPENMRSFIKSSSAFVSSEVYIGQGRIDCLASMDFTGLPPLAVLKMPYEISGSINIRGSLRGSYVLSSIICDNKYNLIGEWSEVCRGEGEILDGIIMENFDTSVFEEGYNVLKLSVTSPDGRHAESLAFVYIDNYRITYPMTADILKPGQPITIKGYMRCPVSNYRIEYGKGLSPAQWCSEGITLNRTTEGMLGQWDTSHINDNDIYCLRLVVEKNNAILSHEEKRFYFEKQLKEGWPVYVPSPVSGSIDGFPIAEDINHDGKKEIIYFRDNYEETNGQAEILVYDHKGVLLWSKKFGQKIIPFVTNMPVIGDINGDGYAEICINVTENSETGNISRTYAFNYEGKLADGFWPVTLKGQFHNQIIGDVNNDGENELISESCGGVQDELGKYRNMVIISGRGLIKSSIRVPLIYGFTSIGHETRAPALGNFDEDPDLEIVVENDMYGIAVYNHDGSLVPGWPIETGMGVMYNGFTTGDLNNDGYDEIVSIAACHPYGNNNGGVYVYDRTGRLMNGWPVLTTAYSFSLTDAALGDFDKDGDLEICVGSDNKVYVFHHDGIVASGWPATLNQYAPMRSYPCIADMDGDGGLDVVTVAGHMQSVIFKTAGHRQTAGGIFAWRFDGTQIDLNPDFETNAIYVERCDFPIITITDLDGNGRIDIVANSAWDVEPYIVTTEMGKVKERSSIYVWELDTPYNRERFPWPTFQHDCSRTSNHSFDDKVPEQLVCFRRNTSNSKQTLISYGRYGVMIFDESTNIWTRIHELTPKTVTAGDLNGDGADELVMDFGIYGIYLFFTDGRAEPWVQIHHLSPDCITIGDINRDHADELIIDFSEYGIYIFTLSDRVNQWVQVHVCSSDSITVGDMDNDSRNELIIDFGRYGIYYYYTDGRAVPWVKLHGFSSDSILAGDIDGDCKIELVIDFGHYGLYIYYTDGRSDYWRQINAANPDSLAIGTYSGYENQDILIDFGIYGLWLYCTDGRTSPWLELNKRNPEAIEAADLNGDGKTDAVVDFGTYGIWVYYTDVSPEPWARIWA